MPTVLPILSGYTRAELATALAELGECRSFRATQVMEWIWEKRATSFEQMSNLPPALRAELAKRYTLRPLTIVRRSQSGAGSTRKLLCQMQDGELVEMVLIPAAEGSAGTRSSRLTLCVSSQVGCAFGCKFCASGLHGFKRNLSTGEIIGQIFAAEHESGQRVDNLVFMGMGEPLANTDHLLPALRLITDRQALGLSPRHITISTSGNVPGLNKLIASGIPVRLAVSLHGATDDVRSRIMPVNRRWPLAELIPALETWQANSKHMLTFEYILISGVNDAPQHAQALSALAKKLHAKVNLIPYNPVQGLEWRRPTETACRAFRRTLLTLHIPTTMRYEKGADINAACGQLRLQHSEETHPPG